MEINRRGFLKSAAIGAAAVAAGGPAKLLASEGTNTADRRTAHAYKYRIAFGAWINDMRNEPLPLQNWPAPQLDDETIDSAIRAMDVQSRAGFEYLDAWGLFATGEYPPDIVSVMTPERRKRLKRLFRAARDRHIKIMFGMGLMTWGFDRILQANEHLRGYSIKPDGQKEMMSHAMCGAKEESWSYVYKILDFAMSEFDFGGVHLESADQGWCGCPECGGKYGTVGYNCRINIRCADYIKSKWPGKIVTSIPINWTTTQFTEQEKAEIIALSSHIDCFMDQGWGGTYVAPSERAEYIRALKCDYGTSGGLWLYPSVRWDRSSYFLPYPKRTSQAIKRQFSEGVRGCMFYQGPMANPGTEVTVAVGGRILSDTRGSVDDALAEVIEIYYKPKSSAAHAKLVDIFQRAEEGYFGQWDARTFAAWGKDAKDVPDLSKIEKDFAFGDTRGPGEFKLDGLWGDSPGPAWYLSGPYLTAATRPEYKKALISILKDLPDIEDKFADNGRIEKIKGAIMVTLTLINSMS